jgi:hypothetical protein
MPFQEARSMVLLARLLRPSRSVRAIFVSASMRALLDAQPLLGGRESLAGGRLLLVEPGAVGAVGAAEDGEAPGAQLGGGIHQLEQRGVVAHHDERAPPAPHELGQALAGVAVEVVRGLVEQSDGCPAQSHPHDAGQHRLAARELADLPVELRRQPGCGERGRRALLEVPAVRADEVEQGGGGVAGGDCPHRVDDGADAEELGEGGVRVEGEALRQVVDGARDRDGPAARRQAPGDQSQQGRLAGAVRADEAGATAAEGAADAGDGRVAVRPGESEVVQDDGGCRRHGKGSGSCRGVRRHGGALRCGKRAGGSVSASGSRDRCSPSSVRPSLRPLACAVDPREPVQGGTSVGAPQTARPHRPSDQ